MRINGWETLGFGYNSLNDEYKNVRLPCCHKTNKYHSSFLSKNQCMENEQQICWFHAWR